MTDLIKGWARVGAWVAVGAGAVAALLGASALSMLAAMAQRATGGEPKPPPCPGRCPCHAPSWATPGARAERKAAKAAKQAAREERKRMRRSVASDGGWYDLGMAACLEQLQAYAAEVRDGRRCGRDERMMRSRRERARMAELRYAIACAEAGAVPGGRVH